MPTPAMNVTTTNSIEGWEINTHLGLVAANVVAGTGLVSEFFAGFSDIFGGRSGSYQTQLQSIYAEALQQLRRQADARGGNWIVGLSVDFDEVSGKGTQMFMVSATGTAVRAEQVARVEGSPATQDRPLTADDLEVMQRRLQVAEATRHGALTLDADTWAFLIQHRVEEALPSVLKLISRDAASQSSLGAPWQVTAPPRALAYIRALEPDVAVRGLYRALADSNVGDAALCLLRGASLVRLDATLAALDGPEPRRALQTLRAHQPQYGPADVEHMNALMLAIPGRFPYLAQHTTSKGLLGERQRWTCGVCGETANGANDRCRRCDRDTQGFAADELTPSGAITLLMERRRVLELLLNGVA